MELKMNYDNMSCGDLVRFAKSRNDYSDKKLNIYEFTDKSFYRVDEIKNLKIINQSGFGLIISRKNNRYKNCSIHFTNYRKTSGGNIVIKRTPHLINDLVIYSNTRNCGLAVGENFSCVGARIFLYEDKKVCIGKDNQWSFQILIRTSDSHAILDSAGNCINKGGDVIIGEHVWLAAQVRILKGVSIAKGCIVGCGSIVTKTFTDENVIIVGTPAKIVKRNITWSRKPPEDFY